jgi:DNA repair exonuclease SbcCD ATPase subunit
MTARFKIDGLAVEGFKAFSISQDIAISGRNCFLFGPNARGKSSVIEAIRWCLFGSERDSDVRNRFREGADCKVELRLKDEVGIWRIERQLRPGSLRSDVRITNPAGGEVGLRDILPNLSPLGGSGGVAVFFSAQQAARARAYGDLSRFQEVLYAHLGLTEAERLCDQLATLLEEQLQIERQRSEEVEIAKRALAEQLRAAESRLENLLRTPPWELNEPPTRSASAIRIRAFVSDLAHALGAAHDAGLQSLEALAEAEKWVRESASTRKEALDRSAKAAKAEYDALSARVCTIQAVCRTAESARERANQIAKQVSDICSDEDVKNLDARLKSASARLNEAMIITKARSTLAPVVGIHLGFCPICGSACDGGSLSRRINSDVEHAIPAETRAAQEVQNLEKAKALTDQMDGAVKEERAAKSEADKTVRELANDLKCGEGDWQTAADSRLAELQQRSAEFVRESKDVAGYITRQLARITAFRNEWAYHEFRDEVQRLRGELDDGLKPARETLRDLEDLRFKTQQLLAAIREEFDAAVDRSLPMVSEQLTEAYRRLTGHPAFDILRVERTQGPDKLAIRVGSTHASVPWSRPEDVLNQGAYTALGLVPHLVFSGLHAEGAELNILIVDDPAQSFDTSHIELLVGELRRASDRAQLILATHEEDRFRPIVEQCFPQDSFQILRVTDFQIDRGPTIEQR